MNEHPPPGMTRTGLPIERDGVMVAPIFVYAQVEAAPGRTRMSESEIVAALRMANHSASASRALDFHVALRALIAQPGEGIASRPDVHG